MKALSETQQIRTGSRKTKNRLAIVQEQANGLMRAAKSIVIEQPRQLSVCLEITGMTDLIQNNFSQKSIEQMLRKHMGLNTQREKKKPSQVLEEARVLNEDGRICISPIAFKKAMLSVAGSVKMKKTELRTTLWIMGASVPITFEKMEPRMDIVRTSGITRAPDIRFRPAFKNWKARMIIQFDQNIAVQSVVDLLNRAGSSGVGEWRPSKDGVYGTFRVSRHISDPSEIGTVESECSSAIRAPIVPSWAMDLEVDANLAAKILAGEQPESEEEKE